MQSITNVLTTYLGCHRARLKFIARFQAALLMRQTTNLAKLAASLKGGVQIASDYRRIQRFLSDYEVDFTVLGRLLVHLLPQNEPYVAVLDRTEWHFENTPVNILMIAYDRDRAQRRGLSYRLEGIAERRGIGLRGPHRCVRAFFGDR